MRSESKYRVNSTSDGKNSLKYRLRFGEIDTASGGLLQVRRLYSLMFMIMPRVANKSYESVK